MIRGIDRASVDAGKVDWQKARVAGGLAFAIVRAAYGKTADRAFAESWPRLREVGLVRGAYLFWRPEEDSLEQATSLRAIVGEAGGIECGRDLPFTIDVEFPKGLPPGANPRYILADLAAVATELHGVFGAWPLLYSAAHIFRDELKNTPLVGDLACLLKCPLWLKRYPKGYTPGPWKVPPDGPLPEVPAPWGADPDQAWIWQYQGDATGFPGFTNTVDMDRFMPLVAGAQGSRVTWLQSRIGAKVDGAFGSETDQALRRWQDSSGLQVDGIVGPRTFAALAWDAGAP